MTWMTRSNIMNDSSDKNAGGAGAAVRSLTGQSSLPAQQGPGSSVAPAADSSIYVLDENRSSRFQMAEQGNNTRAASAFQVTQRPRRRKWGAFLGFLLLVAAPTAAIAYYTLEVATPQFESEFQFGVRSADAARNDATAIFNGMAAASQIGLDSYMIVEFIKSRAMLDHLSSKMDFAATFGDPKIDEWARLKAGATIEEKLEYWRSLVEPYFDLTTGAIYVRVRAFDAENARKIGDIILDRATQLVNEMSQQIRDDALRTANKEVANAETRLKQAVSAVQAFRDTSSRIDPAKEADAGLSSTKTLSDEIARLKAQLAVQRSYLSNRSPAVVASERRIKALEAELASLRNTLTSDTPANAGSSALSQDIGAFSTLTLEQRFAEEHYSSALTILNRAKLTAEQQVSYLAVFVKPTVPSSSTYPDPVRFTLIAFAACLGLWLFLLILFKSIRDR